MRESDAPPVLILSSGLLRAVETARIIQDCLTCPLLVEPALETGRPADDVLQLIKAHADARSLAVVGHNPQLESLAEILAGCGEDEPFSIRTGQALELDLTRTVDGALSGSIIRSLRADESEAAS